MRVPFVLGCMIGLTALSGKAEDYDALKARYEKEFVRFSEIAKQTEEDRLRGKSPEQSKSLEQVVGGLSSPNWFIRVRAPSLLMPYVRNGWMTIGQFDRFARAAEEKRSRDRSPNSDRHVAPIVDGLVSDNSALRDRAVELMFPYVQKAWIAVDQFERIGWENLDARGKGLYLWCAACRRVWHSQDRTYPLNAEPIYELWRKASGEPMALPFLRETAVTWFKTRSSDSDAVRLGEGLPAEARKHVARQLLSVFRTCTTPRERLAVVWMILDLHVDSKDTALTEWYAVEADPALRASLLEATYHAVRAPRPEDDAYESRVAEKSLGAIRKRGPVIMASVELALKDWHPEAVRAARAIRDALEKRLR